MSYLVHKQILPPTVVDCCTTANFITSDKTNLIVAQGNILTVFELIVDGENTRLRAKLQVKLEGKVSSMGSFTGPISGNPDFLILAFADAKASIVEYSLEDDAIKTVSMHFYEYDKFKIRFEYNMPPEVLVDPSNRCAVLRFYRDNFAILPFYTNDIDIDPSDLNGFVIPVPTDLRKPPYQPSFVLLGSQIDPRIKNIVDVKFLHGYFEPTLAILYETTMTTTSRLSVNRDTISLAFVSLGLAKRSCPVINNVDNLPYDLQMLIPLPKPLGGVLVVGANEIMHFDQGTVGSGVAVNGYFEMTSNFSLKDFKDMKLHFDGARYCVLSSDTVLLFTHIGEVFRLKLVKEGRLVSRFDLEQVNDFEETLPSSLVLLKPNYIFAGAHNGDSLLYRFTNNFSSSYDSRPSKKARVVTNDAPDELDFLLDSAPTIVAKPVEVIEPKSASKGFSLEVKDRLISLGPISDFAVGDAAYTHEGYQNLPFPKRAVELVTCSGYRQQSTLCAVQKTVRPYIRSTFDIPDETINMWTCICRDENEESADILHHKYLLITKESRFRKAKSNLYTMVLETGVQFDELKKSSFYTAGPTVFATSVFSNSRVLQVYPEGFRLLDFTAGLKQEVLLKTLLAGQSHEISAWIKGASSAGPYLVLHINDSSALYLQEDPLKKEFVVLDVPNTLKESRLSNICLFEDDSGMMKISGSDMDGQEEAPSHSSPKKSRKKRTVVELDDDLYGTQADGNAEIDENETSYSSINREAHEKTYWLSLVSENGVLEFYTLPSCEAVFQAVAFDNLPIVVADAFGETANPSDVTSNRALLDFHVSTMGSVHFRVPVITAVSKGGDIGIYKATTFRSEGLTGRLSVRFHKLDHGHIGQLGHQTDDEDNFGALSDLPTKLPQKRLIFPFHTVKGLRSTIDDTFISGVFVAGITPSFAFINDRNLLRVHPMTIDGKITSWAPFHNVNCSLGFLYFTTSGNLRIGQFDRRFDYQEVVPLQKIKVNDDELLGDFKSEKQEFENPDEDMDKYNTVSRIDYHPNAKKYCVVSFKESSYSAIKIADPAVLLATDENGDPVVQEPSITDPVILSPGKFFPAGRTYSLDLYSSKTWQLIDRATFGNYENILCMSLVLLDVKVSGMIQRKPYIAVGTATVRGEDAQCRGKLYLYEVIDVVPKPGQPETNSKLKLVKAEEMRGICASFCGLNGFLCVGIGAKIMLYSFEDGEALVGVAFLDANLYVSVMTSIKSLILYGDIKKGIWFAGHQQEPLSRISVLGKEHSIYTVIDVNVAVEDSVLTIVVADGEGNLLSYAYAPSDISSVSGKKLLRKGDFHVGSNVSRLTRIAARGTIEENAGDEIRFSKTQGCLYSALDGSMGFVVPIMEKTYKRLNDLWTELASKLNHAANLNPKVFRQFKTIEKFASVPTKNILDADFVWKFAQQDLLDRAKWARQRGTSNERVMSDFAEIDQLMDIL